MHELRIPFFLIVRHLRRGSKWTLLLIIFLMAIAFINMVFVTSLFNGIIETSNSKIIDTYAGNITVYPLSDRDTIKNADKELEKIRSVEGVAAAAAHYQLPVVSMKYGNVKSSFRVYAINPADEQKVTVINESMRSGVYLKEGDKDGILLGAQVTGDEESATRSFKGIKVGDEITMSLMNNVERKFIVRGIFYSNFIESDYQTFVTEEALREIAPSLKNQASAILVKTDVRGEEEDVIDRLKRRGVAGDLHVWSDSAGLMKSVTKSFISIDVLLSLVATLIAAVTIFIVIYVDISDKREQIGILRALGVRPYLIHLVYILQSAIYSAAGVALGTIIFFSALVPYFDAYPFGLPIGDASLIVDPAIFILRAEIIIVVAVVSGLIPAIMVTRMDMLDEIRGK